MRQTIRPNRFGDRIAASFRRRSCGPRDRRRQPSLWRGEQLEPRHALAAVLWLSGPTASVSEGQQLSFTARLSEASKQPQRVTITTTAGTATYGVDYYAPLRQVLLFSPGQTSQSFSISILKDSITEGRETFTVVASPDNATLGTRSQVVTIVDVGGSTSVNSKFDITFTYDSTITDAIKDKLKQAADRWSNVIVGDLPNVTFEGRSIDDIEIAVTVASASTLPSGVIAAAGYDQRRSGDRGLPYHGQIAISSNFVDAPGIMNTLTHEIGHALGFGSLWQTSGFQRLVSGIGTANPVYVGSNGVREYNALFGTTGSNAPLYEVSSKTPAAYDGSYGSHWRDSVFNASGGTSYELMTSSYNVTGTSGGGPIPAVLSRATVGVMQDLGYVVSYANVERYVKPANSVNGRAQPAGGAAGGGGANARDIARSMAFSTIAVPAAVPPGGSASGRSGAGQPGGTAPGSPAGACFGQGVPRAEPGRRPETVVVQMPKIGAPARRTVVVPAVTPSHIQSGPSGLRIVSNS